MSESIWAYSYRLVASTRGGPLSSWWWVAIDESEFVPQCLIKTFDDIAWHLLLEVKVMDIKNSFKTYVIEISFSTGKKKWNKKFKNNGFNKWEESSSVKFKKNGKHKTEAKWNAYVVMYFYNRI